MLEYENNDICPVRILQEISNTAAINTELRRLQVDIATLQETHLANSCFLPKKGLQIRLAGKGSR